MSSQDLHHKRQWSTWLNVTIDELGEHVEANLVVCDGLDNSNGQREDERYSHRKQERPPVEVCGISQYGDEAEAEDLRECEPCTINIQRFPLTIVKRPMYHQVGASLYFLMSFM